MKTMEPMRLYVGVGIKKDGEEGRSTGEKGLFERGFRGEFADCGAKNGLKRTVTSEQLSRLITERLCALI